MDFLFSSVQLHYAINQEKIFIYNSGNLLVSNKECPADSDNSQAGHSLFCGATIDFRSKDRKEDLDE